MCHVLEFLTDEEDIDATNENDGHITVRRARVIMTGENGWMATEYHRHRFVGNSGLYDTKGEAIEKGVGMLQKSDDDFNKFLEKQAKRRKEYGIEDNGMRD